MLSGRLAVMLVCAISIEDRLLYDHGWLAKGERLMLAGLEVGGCCTKADSCVRADGTPAVQGSCEPWRGSLSCYSQRTGAPLLTRQALGSRCASCGQAWAGRHGSPGSFRVEEAFR